MKILVALMSLAFLQAAFSSNAFAAKPAKSIHLAMQMNLNGKISHPHVIVKPGKTATIEARNNDGTGYKISALPSPTTLSGHKAIMINFEVSEMTNNSLRSVSKPTVVTLIGEKAMFIQGGQDKLELSVTPTFAN